MTASWSGPIRVQPNTSVVRAIDRGQWQAPLGSSHGQPPDHRQPAAVLVRQGQAFGGAEEAPSVTAAAPRRRWKYAVGTEECSRRGSNKRMECKGRPKWRDAPLTMKAPYKPDALIGHVRFDERGWETKRCRMAQATAPILDSTKTDLLPQSPHVRYEGMNGPN